MKLPEVGIQFENFMKTTGNFMTTTGNLPPEKPPKKTQEISYCQNKTTEKNSRNKTPVMYEIARKLYENHWKSTTGKTWGWGGGHRK